MWFTFIEMNNDILKSKLTTLMTTAIDQSREKREARVSRLVHDSCALFQDKGVISVLIAPLDKDEM